MAAVALLKFTQNTQGTAGNGIAMIGVLGQVVTVSNANDTNVQSWQIDLVYTDPDSTIGIAIPYAFSDNGSTPTATFTPDRRRSFRWQLKVWSVINRAGAPDSTDIRVFTVREVNGNIIPPAQIFPAPLPDPRTNATGNKPNEMNFDGQPDGWAGTGADGQLNDTLTKVLNKTSNFRYVDGGTSLPLTKQNGGQSTPYGAIQTALDEIQGSTDDSKWIIQLAPGNYDQTLTVPKKRHITIIGESYESTQINVNSGLQIYWNLQGLCSLSFRNLKTIFITTVIEGTEPPDIATLYLENTGVELITHGSSGSPLLDVTVVGPHSHVGQTSINGRLAVDGANYIGPATCGTLDVYDTLMLAGGYAVSGDTTLVSCQLEPGVDLNVSGYSATLYVDAMTHYWFEASSTSLIYSNLVVMDRSWVYPGKEMQSTSYQVSSLDAHKTLWTANANNVTVTLPHNDADAIPIGTKIYFQQRYFGVIFLVGEDDVVLLTRTSSQTANQNAVIWVIKTEANTWAVGGDLAPGMQPYPFSGTPNTLTLTQLDRLVIVSDASTTTVVVTTHSAQPFPIGTKIDFLAGGTGQVVFAPINGSVQVLSAETLKLRKQYSVGTLIKTSTNVWFLTGDLELA